MSARPAAAGWSAVVGLHDLQRRCSQVLDHVGADEPGAHRLGAGLGQERHGGVRRPTGECVDTDSGDPSGRHDPIGKGLVEPIAGLGDLSGRCYIEYLRAPHGVLGSGVAQYEPVARRERELDVEPDPRELITDSSEPHTVFSGADRARQPAPTPQVGAGSDGQGNVDRGDEPPLFRSDHGVATGHVVPVDPHQVEGHPRAGLAGMGVATVTLDPADADGVPAGLDDVVGVERAAGEGAGHHRSRTFGREDPIDPQARPVDISCRRRGCQGAIERGPHGVEPVARARRAGDDLQLGERRACDVFGHFELRNLERLGVDQIGLRDHDDAVAYVEEVQDPEVLLALGLPPFVRGHHEHRDVDRAHPGQHVLDEFGVPGHVDEADLGPRGQRGEREAEIDREPAGLLLRKPVRVGAGEHVDQGRLPVVHMAGGRDDAH